ncbi:MAG: phytoene desaturase, partial [Bacteroidota bacterium]
KTDQTVAPEGCENLFLLLPIAPDLPLDEAHREHYFTLMLDKLERYTGQNIRKHIVFKRAFAKEEFMTAYNSFKGNAYGLANTLRQTALLKPTLKSAKISNLYYTGQLTVPGPGVPPSIISGQVVAREIHKIHRF